MPGVVEDYVSQQQQEQQEKAHEDLYWSMRHSGYSPEQVTSWMNEKVQGNRQVTASEMLAIHRAEFSVAEYAGERYENLAADVHSYAAHERSLSPNASAGEVYERAAERLIGDIRAYDEAVKQSEPQHRETVRMRIG